MFDDMPSGAKEVVSDFYTLTGFRFPLISDRIDHDNDGNYTAALMLARFAHQDGFYGILSLRDDLSDGWFVDAEGPATIMMDEWTGELLEFRTFNMMGELAGEFRFDRVEITTSGRLWRGVYKQRRQKFGEVRCLVTEAPAALFGNAIPLPVE